MKNCCLKTSDDGSIALVRFTSMQSPAFALRISGSIGTPGLSLPCASRSSDLTYSTPSLFTSGLVVARSLNTICPLGSAFCEVTAVMLNVTFFPGAGIGVGHVAYETFAPAPTGLFGRGPTPFAGCVGAYDLNSPHNPFDRPLLSMLGL